MNSSLTYKLFGCLNYTEEARKMHLSALRRGFRRILKKLKNGFKCVRRIKAYTCSLFFLIFFTQVGSLAQFPEYEILVRYKSQVGGSKLCISITMTVVVIITSKFRPCSP